MIVNIFVAYELKLLKQRIQQRDRLVAHIGKADLKGWWICLLLQSIILNQRN
jgi:hypothetical protein